MELQQLRGFIAVARYGGFSEAAVKTLRTQPAITLQVKSLEQFLGVELLERSPRRGGKVQLTEQGRILYDKVVPLLAEFDSLPRVLEEEFSELQCGSLRIATHTSVMTYIIPEVIERFRRQWPQISLSIVNRGREDIISMVKHGDVDLGITSLFEVPEQISYRVIDRYRRMLIVPRNHELCRKQKISMTEISKCKLIVSARPSLTRESIDKAFAQAGLKYDVVMEVTGREAIKTYVGMGLGCSIVSEFYLTEQDKKKFAAKDVSRHFGHSERGILTRKNSVISRPTRTMLDLLLRGK